MRLSGILGGSALAVLLAAPLGAQTVEDFLKPVEKPTGPLTAENYVDPQIKERRACKDRPGRPGWLMVQPRLKGDVGVGSFGWRRDIGQTFVSSRVVPSVIKARKCSCELMYPDYEQFRADIEKLWAHWDNKDWSEFSSEEKKEFRRIEREIGESYRHDRGEYGSLCRQAGL